MALGGMYDQLGGGFHRYSVDARWLVPHFEKMLYDNALLTSTYLSAFQITAEASSAGLPRKPSITSFGRCGPRGRFLLQSGRGFGRRGRKILRLVCIRNRRPAARR